MMDEKAIERKIELPNDSQCIIIRRRIDDDDGFPQEIITYQYEKHGETYCEVTCCCTGSEKGDSYYVYINYPDESTKKLTSKLAEEHEAIAAFNANLPQRDRVPRLEHNMRIAVIGTGE